MVALAVGTHGEIRSYYLIGGTWYRHKASRPARKPDMWKAVAQFRDDDNVVRQLQRSDRTEAGARRNLREYLAERASQTGPRLTHVAHVNEVAPLYLDAIRRNPRRTGTTYDRYRGRVDNYITPRMGALRITDCTPGRIHAVLQGIERDRPGIAPETLRGIRACISGIMQVAINLDIITTNPVKNVEKIEGGSVRAAEAFDIAQLVDFLQKVDDDEQAARADLPDLIRFLFGTGVRFGEALALRWGDCNLTDQPITVRNPEGQLATLEPHSVWINGNIVRVTGQGSVRHGGKTTSSIGVIGLPDFLHAILLQRLPTMAAAGAGVEQPVFPSQVMGWRAPSNVQRSMRRLRKRIGYPTFTTHMGRKTVAEVLDQAGHTVSQIAKQLRQSSIQTTERHYIKRRLVNPGAAKALNAAFVAPAPEEDRA